MPNAWMLCGWLIACGLVCWAVATLFDDIDS